MVYKNSYTRLCSRSRTVLIIWFRQRWFEQRNRLRCNRFKWLVVSKSSVITSCAEFVYDKLIHDLGREMSHTLSVTHVWTRITHKITFINALLRSIIIHSLHIASFSCITNAGARRTRMMSHRHQNKSPIRSQTCKYSWWNTHLPVCILSNDVLII